MEAFCQNLHLKINGKSNDDIEILKKIDYKKKHINYTSITQEVNALQKQLYKIGYIENSLDTIDQINDSTFVATIQLKTKYNTIYIYYNKNVIEPSMIQFISKTMHDNYFVIDIENTESILTHLNSKLIEKGFPFSKLYLSQIEVKKNNQLKADLIIESKTQKRLLNNIIIKGYENFPKAYLKHYLKIKKNKIFNLKEIKEKAAQLNNLRFANTIKPPEVLFSKDSTTLYMYIKKTKSNGFDGFLGFGTNEETTKLAFDGYVNLSLENNLNYGETFKLEYKSDENDQKTFNADLSLPYLFNTPIGIDFQLNIFKKDSSFTTVNQSAKIHYQINPKHKISTGISSVESNNLLNTTSTLFIEDYKSNYATFEYQYLKSQHQNLLFPIKTALYLETGIGKRKTLETSEKQTQWLIDSYKIIALNNQNSVFLRMNAKNIISNTYFENELLRFGGINSIRGFEENSILASFYGLTNIEYRYQLNSNIYLHSITDIAYFENQINNTKEKLYGYGFGFGILTKSGLLKFNYANGKNEGSPFKVSNSKIHISLVANF
ncbi:POTRA domain-containing protein [Pseudalgibacter alginicilyticus]|uniref:POTRA domain-containing protein n=1 Tax=Pseudalgibacter alginicilyticus TaxID=1736674 RepID=UPI001F26A1AF|nr:POTRA domain-containing protein [Pseudalgibacter alginicilyticus]